MDQRNTKWYKKWYKIILSLFLKTMITEKKFSPKWKVSKHDLISIAITLWLVATPILAYIQVQLTNGEPINWGVALSWAIAVWIKVFQKFVTDYEKKLW